ncbi:MAG: hypothetical protein EBV19_06920, partial [Flavobacteriia bacterium]|nr:hypothetical protein [Flavobacteriia bacterium]
MCGIIGWFSLNKYPLSPILDRIRTLLNRGYDSIGIGYIETNEFIVSKVVAQNKTWEEILLELGATSSGFTDANNIIMHTRWATHGGVSIDNAHPHVSVDKSTMIVHNGIIDNYQVLRQQLISYNIENKSDTDSCVVSDMIALEMRINQGINLLDATKRVIHELKGSWAFVIMSTHDPDTMIIVRKGSPLIIGMTECEQTVMIVSEKSAFTADIHKIYTVQNGEIISLHRDHAKRRFTMNIDINFDKIDHTDPFFSVSSSPHPYPFWTLYEIYQQASRARTLIDHLTSPQFMIPNIPIIDKIIMIGCGTSHHANLISKEFCDMYFRQTLQQRFTDIFSYDASGFDCSKIRLGCKGKIVVICSSQSGETIDLYNTIMSIKAKFKQDVVFGGLINVPGSLIDKIVDFGVYIRAGKEVGVASTKSYTNMVLANICMVSKLIQVSQQEINESIFPMHDVPSIINTNLFMIETFVCEQVIPLLETVQNMFVIGNNIDFCLALENALKIKESGVTGLMLNSTIVDTTQGLFRSVGG